MSAAKHTFSNRTYVPRIVFGNGQEIILPHELTHSEAMKEAEAVARQFDGVEYVSVVLECREVAQQKRN